MMNEEQQKLVTDNINIVHHCIRKHFSYIIPNTYEYEDLFQQGCLGLCMAAKYYDPDESKFSTYGYSMVLGYMRTYIFFKMSSFLTNCRNDGKMTPINVSSGNTHIEDGEGNSVEMFDTIGISADYDCVDAKNDIQYAFIKANKKHGLIIYQLLTYGYTQPEMANEIGMSQAYVSRTIKKAREYYKEISHAK